MSEPNRQEAPDPQLMQQTAPYPKPLAELVDLLVYRREEGWRVWLEDTERDKPRDGQPASKGLTLVVLRHGLDSYHPARTLSVHHYFPVPPATFDRRSWQRWLLDRLGDVDTHERCENFIIDGKRPYAPNHGPGRNPYTIHELATAPDAETDFRGRRHAGTQA